MSRTWIDPKSIEVHSWGLLAASYMMNIQDIGMPAGCILQALLLKVIKQDMADNPKWSPENSCVAKVRDALEQATGRMFGIPPRPPVTGPLDFRDNLDWFGYVVKKNFYPRRP